MEYRGRLFGMIGAHVVGCSDSGSQYRDGTIAGRDRLNGSVIVDNIRSHVSHGSQVIFTDDSSASDHRYIPPERRPRRLPARSKYFG